MVIHDRRTAPSAATAARTGMPVQCLERYDSSDEYELG